MLNFVKNAVSNSILIAREFLADLKDDLTYRFKPTPEMSKKLSVRNLARKLKADEEKKKLELEEAIEDSIREIKGAVARGGIGVTLRLFPDHIEFVANRLASMGYTVQVGPETHNYYSARYGTCTVTW